MDKAAAIELATNKLISVLEVSLTDLTHLKKQDLMPLVGEIDEVDDGWEIELLLAESYCFEVGEDGSCELQGYSCSESAFSNWFYPDARWNPPEGNPPVRPVFYECELGCEYECQRDVGSCLASPV